MNQQPTQLQQPYTIQTASNIVNRGTSNRPNNVNRNNNNNNNNQTNQSITSITPYNNRYTSSLFPQYADQPDIVRASQKDDFYKRLFEEQVFEILTRVAGPRIMMNKQNESKLLSNVTYFILTTLIGSQTLGEEYCNIRQIKDNTFTLPSIINRCRLMFFQLLGPYIIKKYTPKVFLRFPNLYMLKELFPKLERLHLALFYFNGAYYEFSKRLSNIRYIFNRKVDQRRPKYHILGLLIIIQLVVSSFIYLRDSPWLKRNTELNAEFVGTSTNNNGNEEEAANGGKCTLCLEVRKNTTSTVCGHLFCWYCLSEWCNSKAECPLCRRPISLQSLMPVYNY